MKPVKKLVYFYLTFLILMCLFLPFAVSAATAVPQATGNFTAYIIGAACTDSTTVVVCYIEKVFRLFIAIATIGSIFMIVIGGIYLITSGGDPKKVTKGRLAVTGAIIGLVIVLLSYSIQQFVQRKVTGGAPGSNITTETETGLPSSFTDSNVVTVTSNGSTISYTKSGTSVAASINDNGLSCPPGTTVNISGKIVLCQDIRNAFDASSLGVNVDFSSGNVIVYYRTNDSPQAISADTWIASVSAPTQSSVIAQTGDTLPFTGPVTSPSIGCDGVIYMLQTKYPTSTYSIKGIEIVPEEFTVFFKVVGGDGTLYYDIWQSEPMSLFSVYKKTGAAIFSNLSDSQIPQASSNCDLSTQ